MSESESRPRLVILGLGKMGSILLEAFIAKGLVTPERTIATVRHADPDRVRKLQSQFGITVTGDNAEAVRDADVVMLAVKPQGVREVCEEIGPALKPGAWVISVAASVPTRFIEEALGEVPVVRAMPNTPCVVGQGMTGICRGNYTGREHLEITERLFGAVGRSVTVDEKYMDAVTGLSASGPAFIYVILESLAEAGVKVGLPRDTATILAAQTTAGAASMVLHTGKHPALLKDEVTTPAGCTIDGLLELEEGKLRVTLIKAIVKATERAEELVFSG
jgi:pyrroline-5-carboxylate reductase